MLSKIWLTHKVAIEIVKCLTACCKTITIRNGVDYWVVGDFKLVVLENDDFTIWVVVIVLEQHAK